jgi:hypothetical protein
MFDIFFKRSKIVVDCFTTHPNSYELFPIKEASRFLPDWWKSLPNMYMSENEHGLRIPRGTMKRCEGLIGLYNHGFVMPLWTDLIIESDEKGFVYHFADSSGSIGYHDDNQRGNEFKKYTHAKIHTPWRIQEKTGVKFLFLQPSWNMPNEITGMHTPPGIIDFTYQHATNVNTFLLPERRYEWPAGKPLAHFVPLSDKEVEIKLHFIGKDDANISRIMEPGMPSFLSSYQKIKKIQQTKSKCPFGGKS